MTPASVLLRVAVVSPLLLLVSTLQVAKLAASPPPDHVVYPTGQSPADAQNVQAALDQGGVVLLKATNTAGAQTAFNFGAPQSGSDFVEFNRDAELVGESLANAATTINGGFFPVRLEQNNVVAVRNINFTASFYSALFLEGGGQITITGNHISNLLGEQTGSRTTGESIIVGFAGRVIISDNVIDAVTVDRGYGVSLFGCIGPVDILRNRISNTGYGTIECSYNFNFQTGEYADVRIEDNVLRPGPALKAFGVGMELNGEGNYYAVRNDIVIESAFGLGFYVLGFPDFGIAPVRSPVIEENKITVQVDPNDPRPLFADGIDLVGSVSHAYVGQNSIDGEAFSALGLYNISDSSDLGFNTYVGNSTAKCESTVADVFLDVGGHDTVLKGRSGTVIDLGTNNQITGFGNVGHSASGQQVRQATQVRIDAAREARRARDSFDLHPESGIRRYSP